MWGMQRESAGWRANVDTSKARLVDVPARVAELTLQVADHLGADVLGLDVLQAPDGSWVVLEVNETPGLSGFPEAARLELASVLWRKIQD